VILSVGLVFAKGAGVFDADLLAPAIYAMAALTAVTVVQRVWHVRNELSRLGADVQQAPVEPAVPPEDV
jgi:CDP-diacylglycerol--glycerol-3-phosphate 3-phosphatidyltransferase